MKEENKIYKNIGKMVVTYKVNYQSIFNFNCDISSQHVFLLNNRSPSRHETRETTETFQFKVSIITHSRIKVRVSAFPALIKLDVIDPRLQIE